MGASKHTQGPWEVTSGPRHYNHSVAMVQRIKGFAGEVEARTHVVADIPNPTNKLADDATAMANARLIAAAPEMLEALKRCEELLSSITSISSELAEFRDGYLRQARAAIAKAEGRS